MRKTSVAALPHRSGRRREEEIVTVLSPAKPTHTEVRHGDVASHGLCSSLGTMPDKTVSQDPDSHCRRKIDECGECFSNENHRVNY